MTGAETTGARPGAPSKQSWRPLIVIALSMVMMYITSFGINVLISSIVTDLGTTVATLQAVIVAASFIAGSLMVTAGRLGDKFGRKKIFVLGVAIYTIGLTIVVLSPNTTVHRKPPKFVAKRITCSLLG